MKPLLKEAIQAFLNFSGNDKTPEDFRVLLKKINLALVMSGYDEEAAIKLTYIKHKVENGLSLAIENGVLDEVIVNDTEESLDQFYQDYLKQKHKGDDMGKIKPPKKKEDLGKLVDEGDVPYPDRADAYWNKKDRLKVVFQPNNREIRTGPNIPNGYTYENMTFLQAYYNLRAISFGNWLSQQDRLNYVAGLGISLYDLHKVLDFRPQQISLGGKLSVAFGARGRGSALAHFEPDTFCINITRYSRPKKGSTKQPGFQRVKLLVAGGGVGSFAHEFGHALDYYAGKFIKQSPGGALSNGRSSRVKPNKKLMKEDNAAGYMERLLNKIIWKNDKKHSAYYERLLKGKKAGWLTGYYFRRNELFARAFESYVHYKMQKRKYKNIFLAETKYSPSTYLTPKEMKGLEKDFDQLINSIKWKIKNA